MRQKGFAPIIILIVVVLGIAVYLGYKYTRPPSRSYYPQTTPIPLTDGEKPGWKKYINTRDGYSLEFPVDKWQLSLDDSENAMMSLKCDACGNNNNEASIGVYMPLNQNTLAERKEWLSSGFGASIDDRRVVEIEDTTFAGLPATTTFEKPSSDAPGSYSIFVSKNNKGYIIGASEKPSKGSVIDQILSTFKFTD